MKSLILFLYRILRSDLKHFLTVLLLTISISEINAQTKVNLRQADLLTRGQRDTEAFDRLIGNVIFEQNETVIYCDSAYFFKEKNSVEAFGNVRILEGDSVTVTGKFLEYDGNTKQAELQRNVVFTKLATATLYTDHLYYDRTRNLAYYRDGGRLVDSINVLTSRRGYYDVNSHMASFKRNVNVKNPDYTMTSDSLQYNSRTKVIFFRTETKVVNNQDESFIYKGGNYNTITKKSLMTQGLLEARSYTIVGKRYDLDDMRKIYKIREDVAMTYRQENLTIYGQSADHYRRSGIAKVYDKAWLAKVTDDNDTLYMTADTLVSIDSQDPKKKRLLAYNNVKVFKKNMQAVADSVEYRPADSTIYMYVNPVLWAEENQMTADSINLVIRNNTIDRIYLKRNSFIVSQDTIQNFNQIKGRMMVAEFTGSNLKQVLVQGNGESIYFALNEENTSYIGMNQIICSNIIIRFREGRVNTLSFYVNPDARFIPPHQLKEEEKKLKDFKWKQDVRPARKEVVRSAIPNLSNP